MTKPTTTMREERDAMGTALVPSSAYYGAQTARSLAHFAIGQERMPLSLIHAYGVIKRAAAETNGELGLLPAALADDIARASQEVAAGLLDAHFPLSVWQTGSGTQTNMNVNEVIANRVSELSGEPLGSRKPAHPNDHVNLGQSSNDTFPTAMHVAAVVQIELQLLPAVRALHATLHQKSEAFADVIKIGRTHLQDAVPMTFGQEISGWAAQLEAGFVAIDAALPSLRELALGGTAVGTGLNAHPRFAVLTIERIAAHTGITFVPARNYFAALAGHDACVRTSGALKQLAAACMKIANDVRWLASGPRAGLGEIEIPKNEPGSSIMPGKANPTQCEALTMVACQVMGNDATIGFAASQGNFELNVYKPLIAHGLLQSIGLLADACSSFDRHCAQGIEPRRDVLQTNVERSLMLVTALTPAIGYDAAARTANYAYEQSISLREAAVKLGLMTAERFDELVDPAAMTRPG
jgi:fumarate hydratase class II